MFQIKKLYAKLRKLDGEFELWLIMLLNIFEIPCDVWKLLLRKLVYIFGFSYKFCCDGKFCNLF